MRILHIVPSLDPKSGGMSQAVKTLVAGLQPKGVKNEIVSLDDVNAAFVNGSTMLIHAIGKGTGPWCYNETLYPWLIRNLAAYNKVIVHGLWQYPGYALYKAVRKLGAKAPQYYVMPHGMLDPYFQRAKGRRLKAFRNILYWRFLEQRVINTADGLLFTCEEEQRLAQEPFSPYHPQKEFIVGLGVEEPPLKTQKMMDLFYSCYPELQNKRYLLFLSRIHEKKGVDMLIEAYREIVGQLSKASPHAEVPKLMIAGPGLETTYGRQIFRQVDSSPGLKDNVIFPGMLSGDMKWGAYYGAEAFVLPSHQENFGIAVVEALACSKAVLISNQVNIHQEIAKGKAAVVSEDTLQGTFKLLKYWTDLAAPEREMMQKNGREVYEQCFAVEPVLERMIQLLKLKDKKYGPVTA